MPCYDSQQQQRGRTFSSSLSLPLVRSCTRSLPLSLSLYIYIYIQQSIPRRELSARRSRLLFRPPLRRFSFARTCSLSLFYLGEDVQVGREREREVAAPGRCEANATTTTTRGTYDATVTRARSVAICCLSSSSPTSLSLSLSLSLRVQSVCARAHARGYTREISTPPRLRPPADEARRASPNAPPPSSVCVSLATGSVCTFASAPLPSLPRALVRESSGENDLLLVQCCLLRVYPYVRRFGYVRCNCARTYCCGLRILRGEYLRR